MQYVHVLNYMHPIDITLTKHLIIKKNNEHAISNQLMPIEHSSTRSIRQIDIQLKLNITRRHCSRVANKHTSTLHNNIHFIRDGVQKERREDYVFI